MPVEALEFFGSFINMDNPRHARQRAIVGRSFAPREIQGVMDSVSTICTEVIDDFCEDGEVDLVKVLSQPFPLLVICDMMGIPRSEFDTVLRATNIILGAGDPEFMGSGDMAGSLPDKISIYRIPLEESFPDPQELRDEIRITVLHELAHYFGLDEDRIAELGYD